MTCLGPLGTLINLIKYFQTVNDHENLKSLDQKSQIKIQLFMLGIQNLEKNFY